MAEQEMIEYSTAPWMTVQDQTISSNNDTSSTLTYAQRLGYSAATFSITTETFHQRIYNKATEYLNSSEDAENNQPSRSVQDENDSPSKAPLLLPPLTPEDTDLAPGEANFMITGLISPWIDLSSNDSVIRHVSQQVFKLEMAYAAFCGLQYVTVHGPLPGGDVVSYARSILGGLATAPFTTLQVLLPMSGELEKDTEVDMHLSELVSINENDEIEDDAELEDEFSVWSNWDIIRSICDYHSRLAIALEIPRQLPSVALRNRWSSEPLRSLVFPRTAFLRNAKDFPVLSKQHQAYLSQIMRLSFPPMIVLSGTDDVPDVASSTSSMQSDPTPAESTTHKSRDPAPHLSYILHLSKHQPARSQIEKFGERYEDYIQLPLQPLADNLQSLTYEVFEKDPIKYEWYERAVLRALRDLAIYRGSVKVFNVAVAGSGRGPLVSRVLLAAQKAELKIRCWAVEKNPNAYVHLQRRNATDPLWNNAVTVVKTDMRAWKGPVVDGKLDKVDILVSELLGSFGDNELSPECLDGVQHVLRPETGINIPQSYTAHLAPISTPKLYADLLSRPTDVKWEIPAVVMLQRIDYLSLESDDITPNVKQAWKFSHPVPEVVLNLAKLRAGGAAEGGPGGIIGGDGSNEHNSRYTKLTFDCKHQSVCHGLAGYFETILYHSGPKTGNETIELSINPVTIDQKSKDMISWFPIFFPLKNPLHVPEHTTIQVSMWRMTDDSKVWYEWLVEILDQQKKRVAVSELHSSKKNGCLL